MRPSYLCVLDLQTMHFVHPFHQVEISEITTLSYILIDVLQKNVAGKQQYCVKPQLPEIRDQIYEELDRQGLDITQNFMDSSMTLENAVQHFKQYVQSTFNINPSTHSLCFVTCGQHPLRHHLFREAQSKNFKLPRHYTWFFDIKKEFATHYEVPLRTLTLSDMLNYLTMDHYNGYDYHNCHTGDIVNVTLRLLAEGHEFDKPHRIQLQLASRLYKSSDPVTHGRVVKLVGIPRDCTEQQVAKFFIGLNIAEGGVALSLNHEARRDGRALVRFKNKEHRHLALKRNLYCFRNGHVKVRRASGRCFINVAGGNNEEVNRFLLRDAHAIIKMTGVPVNCTAKRILAFFEEGENPCKVKFGEGGVYFIKSAEGFATEVALALFEKEEDAAKALGKHQSLLGLRRIQVSRITIAEVQQVVKHLQ